MTATLDDLTASSYGLRVFCDVCNRVAEMDVTRVEMVMQA